jgi:hypothetical protein
MDQTGEISRYVDEAFHSVSVPQAAKLGLGSSDVLTVTADQYNKVPKGNDYLAEGMYIWIYQRGEVDIYTGVERHTIPVSVLATLNLDASRLTTISVSQFNGMPQGNDYSPDGSFLQNQVTGEISQCSGGWSYIVYGTVATVMGLDPSRLISVTAREYTAIPSRNAYYPDGSFVENNQTGEID